MKNAPAVSVIMPVYNLEEYLKEAVDSVIYQTIGFEENIEIIFVNDGSTDSSESICKEYEAAYPDNIYYIKQSNKGVSAARNRGLLEARGKYVNFFDGDDKWESRAFEVAVSFFETNYDEIDVVSCRQRFFEKNPICS